MNIVVDGLMASYKKAGQGKIVILLPGWGDSYKSFVELIKRLQTDYQVLALDLPGFGGSQTPDMAWTVDNYAEFVNSWIRKLNIEPYAILGHSFGGSIAIKLAASQPKFKRLVLVAAAGVRNKKPGRKKLIRTAAKVGKIPLYALPKTRRDKIKRRFYGAIGSDALLLPHMQATYRQIIDQDLRQEATKIKLPTLLIYGQTDKDTPLADGQNLHGLIKDSELEVLNASHFLHQDQPDQTANIILGFLGQ